MAEWLKAHAWKACLLYCNAGSNPALSARNKKGSERIIFYFWRCVLDEVRMYFGQNPQDFDE